MAVDGAAEKAEGIRKITPPGRVCGESNTRGGKASRGEEGTLFVIRGMAGPSFERI
jgi:hypothetical protein